MPFKRDSTSNPSLPVELHSDSHASLENGSHRKRRGSWSNSLKARLKTRLHKWSAPDEDSNSTIEELQDTHYNTSISTPLRRSRSSTGSHAHRSTEERELLRRRSLSDLRSTDRDSGPHKYTQDTIQRPKITFIDFEHTPSEKDITHLAQQISREANAELRPGSGRVDVIVVDSTSGRPSCGDSQVYHEESVEKQRIGKRRDSAVGQSDGSQSEADWRDMRDPTGTSHHPVIANAWQSQAFDPSSQRSSSMSTAPHYPVMGSASSSPATSPAKTHPYPFSAPTAQAPTPVPELAKSAAATDPTLSAAEVDALVQFLLNQQPSAGCQNTNQSASSAMATISPASTSSLVAAH